MKIDLAKYHPLLDIQENRVYASNGNLVLCYRLELPEVYSLSESDFEDLHTSWFQALRTLMTGCVVQKQDIYRKRKYSGQELPGDSFLGKATRDYFQGRQYLHHESYLFFTWPRSRALNNPKFVNPFRRIPGAVPRDLDAAARDFQKAVNSSVALLNNSKKIALAPMSAAEILALSNLFFNGFSEGKDTDLSFEGSHLQAGDNFFDVLSVNNEGCFGEYLTSSKLNEQFTSDDFLFHQGLVDGLGLALDEDHIVNQVIYLDDQQKWRRLLEKRIGELKKSSRFGSQNRAILEKVQSVFTRIQQDDTSRLVRGHFNVIFWGKSRKELARAAARIQTAFRELDMLPYYPLGEERMSYFLNSFFCYASHFSNEDLYVAELKHALCLLINNSNYKSDAQGVVFNDRQHNLPVLKDVWDEEKKRIKARNFAIFAPTGEGKSFLANHILRQYFEMGTRLVVIDLGGSYSKFAKLYPGDHLILRYQHGKSLGINPFFLSDTSRPDPQHFEELSGLLLELSGGSQARDKGQEVALKKILRHYYSLEKEPHSLQGFYDFVSSRQERLLEELQVQSRYFNLTGFLHILSEYVGDGLYSFLFRSGTDNCFQLEDKRLIVFELDEIRDNKEILAVMLKLIRSAIQRTIWQNRSEKGIILFDEFAKQLKFDKVLESVEFYYQAIRKQNGAIGIILQSINQLPQNATAASILENTQVVYSLHNEKGYQQLQERLNLSSHDLNQLRSIRNQLWGKQKYTEMFIKIGKESNIFRLEVPPEVYAAYLTDGKENDQLMACYQELRCMEKAIKKFIKH